MTPPDYNEAKRLEDRRREFLERCAVAAMTRPEPPDYVDAGDIVPDVDIAAIYARAIIADASALWDAIEADAKGRKP